MYLSGPCKCKEHAHTTKRLQQQCVQQIKEILRLAPRKRQTMLFSATMTEEVQKLASLSLQNPVRLAADLKSTAPSELTQEIIRIKVRHLCGIQSCVAWQHFHAEIIMLQPPHNSGWAARWLREKPVWTVHPHARCQVDQCL